MMASDTRLTPAASLLTTETNVQLHAWETTKMVNSNRTAPARKARTASDTFPLFQRSDGRWCKKIRGKHRYFGRDKDKAFAKYQREIGLLVQGIEPDPGELGLRELFNRYLEAQQRRLQAGEIGARTVSDSASTLRRSLAILNDRLVSSLVSADFAGLKTRLAKGRSIVTASGDVRRLKAAFNWARDEGLIDRVPLFGSEFKPAPARAVRLAKSRRAAMLFEPEELRELLKLATPQLRAWIFLGANCALLPVDVARLEFEEIDRDIQWLRQARHKTGVDRSAALWPETATALREAIALRYARASPEHAGLVFLTEHGHPVVRVVTPAKAAHDPKAQLNATVINRVTSDFRELQQTCNVYRKGRGFGALRHTFLTVAESGRDFPAVARVMGHSVPGVTSHYREHIGDDRIQAVCAIVHRWLFDV
jgi:integrase